MKISFLFISCLMSLYVNGQFNLFIKSAGNYPIIPASQSQTTYANAYVNIQESYKSRAGFDIEVGFRENLKEKFAFEVGWGISLINFQLVSKSTLNYSSDASSYLNRIETGNPLSYYYGFRFITNSPLSNEPVSNETGVQSSSSTNNYSLSKIIYVNIPVNFRYALTKKISIGLGIAPTILAYSKIGEIDFALKMAEQLRYENNTAVLIRWREPEGFEGTPLQNIYKQDVQMTKLLVNSSISADYAIYKNFKLFTAYQHSFTRIYEENGFISGNPKSRLIKIGLGYNW